MRSEFSSNQKIVSCGFASEVITPKLGLQLAGFIGPRKAVGIHDDLKVRVFYLEFSKKENILLIVFDVLGIPKELSFKVKKILREKFAISEEHVFVAATHTHSGPQLSNLIPGLEFVSEAEKGTVDENDLSGMLIERCVSAVTKAFDHKQVGRLSYGAFIMKENVCGNRREKKEGEACEVKVLLFTGTSGDKALLYNFGCHPTVLHELNLEYSADFPGAVERNLLKNVENLKFVMYVNGAAGDISTRFYRKASNFEEVDRIGAIIAEEIKENIINIKEALEFSGDFYTTILRIKLALRKPMQKEFIKEIEQKAYEDLEKAMVEKKPNLRIYQARLEGLKFLNAVSHFLGKNKEIETLIQLALVDGLAFIGVPGELFSSLGSEIEKRLFPLKVFIFGYSNDYVGYILDKESYDKDEYESFTTLLEKGDGEKIVDLITSSISSFKQHGD